MLIRFAVSNFLSFGEEAEFNTLTGSPRRLKEHIYSFGDLELLKMGAIYGPNGAGKSNLVKAIGLLQKIVLTGTWDKRDIRPFRLNPAFEKKPTTFEAEFVIQGNSLNYGLSIYKGVIQEEWLYKTHFGKREEMIFYRNLVNGETVLEVHNRYTATREDRIRIDLYASELVQDDKPLIKSLAEAKKLPMEEVKQAMLWFERHLAVIFPRSSAGFLLAPFIQSPAYKQFANDLLCSLQTGISALDIKTYDLYEFFGADDKSRADEIRERVMLAPEPGYILLRSASIGEEVIAIMENDKVVIKRLVSRHTSSSGTPVEFTLDEESDGTIRILDLIPALHDAIMTPSAIVVDEIDQSIHPHLLKMLVSKFASDSSTKGQFIFTTHESNLLDQSVFRQDEIWLTEKKNTGETTLYPLSEFDFRYDLDIRKGYLHGRFGAIPFMGDLEKLKWGAYAEEEQGL